MADRLVDGAAEIQAVCVYEQLGFCFIGGLAVLRWGEPRLTRDVDVTVLAGYGLEASVVRTLLDAFASRIEDPEQFALANRVLLLEAANGTPIDVALGALPFEERSVERATEFELAGQRLRTCSAEDLIVHKVFAGRAHDWQDVEGIVARSHDLDVGLIRAELPPLLAAKGTVGDLARLESMLG